MIDWIDFACKQWARQYRRRYESDIPIPSMLGRIMTEGEGASIREFKQRVYEGFTGDALKVHVALQRCDLGTVHMVHFHYRLRKPSKWKAAQLDICPRTYWNRLHSAHVRLADQMESICTIQTCTVSAKVLPSLRSYILVSAS